MPDTAQEAAKSHAGTKRRPQGDDAGRGVIVSSGSCPAMADPMPEGPVEAGVLLLAGDSAFRPSSPADRVPEIVNLVQKMVRRVLMPEAEMRRALSDVTVDAKLGDLRHFDTPRQHMAYPRLVLRAHSSGGNQRQGSIMKTGNSYDTAGVSLGGVVPSLPGAQDSETARRAKHTPPASPGPPRSSCASVIVISSGAANSRCRPAETLPC